VAQVWRLPAPRDAYGVCVSGE